MHHVGAREASDGVIFAQINRLLGTNFLAHPAINAADHVDIEFLRKFFYLGEMVCRRNLTGNNFDCPRRTNELAKLTRDTANPSIRIAHQRWGAAIMIRQVTVPFFLGILHRHFGASEQHILEMLKRDCQAGRNCWQIQSLAPVQSRSCNGNRHPASSATSSSSSALSPTESSAIRQPNWSSILKSILTISSRIALPFLIASSAQQRRATSRSRHAADSKAEPCAIWKKRARSSCENLPFPSAILRAMLSPDRSK